VTDAGAVAVADSKDDIDRDTRGEGVSHALIDDLSEGEGLDETDFEPSGLWLWLGDELADTVTNVDRDIDSIDDREWVTWAEALIFALLESDDETDGLNDVTDDWLGHWLADAESLEA
jgi:hypothetical protein